MLDAFARVPRHVFLPGVALDLVYDDDAIVTHDADGVPTSSSTQPSLMARMIDLLDVRPGDRVLEIGTGTGYNAAVIAELGAAVTTVELQPEAADAAIANLRAAGIDPGAVAVAAGGDGAAPPPGPYDRIIFTAGCWSLPAAVVDGLADDGVLVAPLRINGSSCCWRCAADGTALTGRRDPVRVPADARRRRPRRDAAPWRWQLGGGGAATADADLGVEGRGALDRLLAAPGRAAGDPLGLADDEQALDAMLWLGLQGDPLLSLLRPRRAAPAGPRAPRAAGVAARVLARGPLPRVDATTPARRRGRAARLPRGHRGLARGRLARSGGAALRSSATRPQRLEPARPPQRRRGDHGTRRPSLDAALRRRARFSPQNAASGLSL